MTSLFQASDITKRYGAVTVLDGVSFDVKAGEIHALIGANGAGKSTLCKIIAGLVDASRGSMTLGGKEYRPFNKQTAEKSGVEIVQQELSLISTLSVAENIFLNRMPHFAGVVHKRVMATKARQALARFGLKDIATDTPVGKLGVGRQQMVEIAAALDRQCRILILDEPTAALSGSEADRLFENLRSLRDQGIGIIYISHRLSEVALLSDRVTVLCDGKHVCTSATATVSTGQMIELMSGNSASSHLAFTSHARDQVALQVSGISAGVVQDVSFAIKKGERLGITGLVGSGRTELLRLVFGADRAERGSIQLNDQVLTLFKHPNEAVAAGLAMVNEDRKQSGLLLSQSIRVNTSLSSLGQRLSSWGVIQKNRERIVSEEMVERLETKCIGIDQRVETLSGGNQQKVAISKWLVKDANVFLFDEPTRGIDVSARRRIYRLFESLAEAGKSLVIVSSDLDELMENCDRIGVMSAGRWVTEFDRQSWTVDRIMQASFSGYVDRESVA